MARIRSIHPGWHTDEAVMELTVECPLAAILLTGIWCESDDDGVFDWKPLTLKARCLPAVNEDIHALLTMLEEKDIIRCFESGEKRYGAIRNFRRFQRPQKPKGRDLLPDELRIYVGLKPNNSGPGSDQSGTSPVPVRYQSGSNTGKSIQREDGGGREGGRKEEKEDDDARASAKGRVVDRFLTLRAELWPRDEGCAASQPTLKTQAGQFLDTAPEAAIIDHLEIRMARMAAKGRSPPDNLKFFAKSLAEAGSGNHTGKMPDSRAERHRRIIERVRKNGQRAGSSEHRD